MISFIKENKDYLILSFFIVSIMCWIFEIFFSLIDRFKFVVPGAWYGPYCPIYGLAFIIILLVTQKKANLFVNGLKIFIAVSVVEYLISFISSEMFNNIIWDYHNEFLNINGRICLEMSLIFTLFGLVAIYLVDPALRRIYNDFNSKVKIINKACLMILSIDMFIKLVVGRII